MKKFSVGLCTIVLVIGFAGISHAFLINGDFSAGLDGWQTVGDVAIATDSGYSDPFSGNYALLGGSDTAGNSSLSQGFTVPVGTSTVDISFDYVFAGSDLAGWTADDALVRVRQVVGILDFYLFQLPVIDSTELLRLESLDGDNYRLYGSYFGQSDTSSIEDWGPNNAWLTFSLHETYAGWDDWRTDGTFAVDNVNVTSSAPVPEPATILLLGGGLLGVIGYSYGRRKRLSRKS
jgi:hypothetical protein